MELASHDFSHLKRTSSYPKTPQEQSGFEYRIFQHLKDIQKVTEPHRITKEIYHQAIEESAADIKKLYRQHDLHQPKEPPAVLILDNKARADLKTWIVEEDLNTSQAIFSALFNTIIVFESPTELRTVRSIYHEMFHALAATASGAVERPDQNLLKCFAHVGLSTQTPENVSRSTTLEEGLTVHYSNQLAYDFLLRHHLPTSLDQLQQVSAPRYKAAEQLAQQLIHDGGKDLERLLLAARLGGSRRQLLDALKELYDQPTARAIFSVPTKVEEITQLAQKLHRLRHPNLITRLFHPKKR